MKIIFLRHAETAWNAERRFQGHTDIPLSETGRAQGRAWRAFLPANPDLVFTSPLERALETATILYPEITPIICPALREMGLGHWEGRLMEEVRALSPRPEFPGLDYSAPGGESMRQVQERLLPWLRTLGGEGLAVAVAHKMTITALYAMASGWELDRRPDQRVRFPRAHHFHWDGQLKIILLNESLGAV